MIILEDVSILLQYFALTIQSEIRNMEFIFLILFCAQH